MRHRASPRVENDRSPDAAAFVGREREMEALLTALEDAASARGRLFILAGEPGIGKSWLADELASAARTRGFRVLWGRCWEAGGAPAYWPWVQVLRAVLRDGLLDALRAQLGAGAAHIAQILPELHDLLPGLPAPPSVNPDAARFALFDAVTGFLRNVATAQPSVAILDDLHAADTPSLLLLQFLASELREGRLLVVGTYRNTELGIESPLAATLSELARQPGTRTLSLGGLSRPELARFIELTVGRAPSDRLLAAVHRETEGNPLFVREVVELLAHEGRLDPAEDAPFQGLGIPQGIKQVIGRRLGQLPDACKHVLTVASVLGREFDAEVVGGVAGLSRERLVQAFDEAVAARVVTEAPTPGQLRFSHALVRDVLYDDLSPSRRVSLHQRTGEVLEALYAGNLDPHLAELAHHFTEATPAGTAGKAVRYGRAAGDRAIDLLAYEEAVRLYRMALRACDAARSRNDVERCELRLALGDAQARAGQFPAAKETFLSAADLARTSRDLQLKVLDAKISEHKGHAFGSRIDAARLQLERSQSVANRMASSIVDHKLKSFQTIQELAALEADGQGLQVFHRLRDYYKTVALKAGTLNEAVNQYYRFLSLGRPGEGELLLTRIEADIAHVERYGLDPGGQWMRFATEPASWLGERYLPWYRPEVQRVAGCLTGFKELRHLRHVDESINLVIEATDGIRQRDLGKYAL